jgi:hypothetical protein
MMGQERGLPRYCPAITKLLRPFAKKSIARPYGLCHTSPLAHIEQGFGLYHYRRIVMAKTMQERKTTPEKKLSFAGIGVAIWLNEAEGQGGEIRYFRSVTINPRRYRDPESGAWKDAGSFRVSDLPALAFALQRAIDYCFTEPLPGQGSDEERS